MRLFSFDWSGADKHTARLPNIACYAGIAGATPILLRAPDGNNWTRRLVVEWLETTAQGVAGSAEPMVIGMDFPFSFPWAVTGRKFSTGKATRQPFWEHIHTIVWPNGDAQQFVDNHRQFFDQRNGRGAQYAKHHRVTELAGRAAGHMPLSVYNLCGVSPGKAAICGIAILQEVTLRCQRAKTPLLIWPFFQLDADGVAHVVNLEHPLTAAPGGYLVIVETYPKVFWNQSGQQLKTYGDPATWNAVRAHFHNTSAGPVLPRNEDQADALIAWYGMSAFGNMTRLVMPSPAMLAEQQADPQAIEQEGWIVGL